MEHAHDHGPGHGHAHGHDAAGLREGMAGANQRRLLAVLATGLVILVLEVAAGFLANSLALLSDAAHMSTDVASLALAYGAARLAMRPASASKSYGYYRAEIVAAFLNALLLWGVSVYFIVEAVSRLRAPPGVDGPLVAIVGGLTLVANLTMAAVLHRGQGHSLNVRSAYLHVLSDALGSFAALAAGLGMLLFGWAWLDPLVTLLISVLLIGWTWRLTRDTLHILLEGTPHHVDAAEVRAAIASVPGVVAVHDLHVWSLTTGRDNLSAHVVAADPARGPELAAEIRERLQHDFALRHITLEIERPGSECASCQ